mmetsp:Transcript_25367/g.64435  ORF Transcript_25367/g.64435 Transcript_25367/m.64435 type:complete len:303 (-) Transcript_25367:325-1233(-)
MHYPPELSVLLAHPVCSILSPISCHPVALLIKEPAPIDDLRHTLQDAQEGISWAHVVNAVACALYCTDLRNQGRCNSLWLLRERVEEAARDCVGILEQQVGQHHAWRKVVHADARQPVLHQLGGQRLVQLLQRHLGRLVRHRALGELRAKLREAQVEDVEHRLLAVRARLLAHDADGLAAAQQRPQHVGAHHARQLRRLHVSQQLLGSHLTCVVDPHVHAPQRLLRHRAQPGHRFRVRHVTLCTRHLACTKLLLQCCHSTLDALRVAPAEHHLVARLQELARHGKAHALGASSNHNVLGARC